MKQKEVTKTFMMISNCKKTHFGLYGLDKNISPFTPYSAGIDFSRHNLPSVDVRFWRLKSIPAL